ncbi:hypothetical protein LguiB_017115 [Lonicera macranthoides]
MDAIQLHSSSDQSISPYKQNIIRNPRKNYVPLISRPSDQNFAPPIIHGGLLYTPQPSLSYSYPPFSYLRTQQQQQPPLLPLPLTNPYNNNNNNNNCRTRGISCPPINRKINNRSKHQSLTQKKSKPSITGPPKRTDSVKVSGLVKCNGESKSKSITNSTKASSKGLMIESTKRLGPDPKDLPRVVSKVLSSSSSGNFTSTNNNSSDSNINSSGLAPTEDDEVVKFSGSIMFTLSPPPSSLPLPTFSLRPKLSCKAEAAAAEIEIDAGATDSLRRLLRLR